MRHFLVLGLVAISFFSKSQNIYTAVGNGSAGFGGDGGPATAGQLNSPAGVAFDGAGNLYVADKLNHRVRKVTTATGVIVTVAGNGTAGFSGDNGAATSAQLNGPLDVAVDGSGNLYISDQNNHRIRKVDASTGIITTVAGNGILGFSGDNGQASAAQLHSPWGIALDGGGNIYIADLFNFRVRKVTAATGIITTVAGTGTNSYGGDNGLATSAQISSPTGVTVDGAGNLYIADQPNQRIRKVNASTGIIVTVAGNGINGASGDYGPAINANLGYPTDVVVDSLGNLYISDQGTSLIRKVNTAGIITRLAGLGNGYSGDNGPAINALLSFPQGMALNTLGDLYIADYGNNRIRRITNVIKNTQTITFNPLPAKKVTDSPFALTASASSALPVSYLSNNPTVATISGNIVTIVGPGTSTLSADQPGDANYFPAPEVTQTLTVDKATQDIAFEFLAPATVATGTLMLTATSSSGLPISYLSSNPNVATINGNLLTITGYGTTNITATQSGNGIYDPATDVVQVLTVDRDPIVVYNVVTPNNDGAHDFLKIKFVEEYENTVYLYDRWGNEVFEANGYDNNEPLKRFEGIANVGGNRNLNEGTYFYVIDVGLAEKMSGFLELIR